MQVHGTRVGIQLPGAEVVFLVSLRDAEDDIVSGVGGGGSNAEDLCRDDDVGLEAEVIVGDSQGRVLTVQVVQTADPLTATTQGHREKLGNSTHIGYSSHMVKYTAFIRRHIQTMRLLNLRVGHFAVVWWTAKRQAAVRSLDVVAGLSLRAVMGPCGALINI